MRLIPIAWTLNLVKNYRQAGHVLKTARTPVASPVQTLATCVIETLGEWRIIQKRIQRNGISIGWKRRINHRYGGMILEVDGHERWLSNDDSRALSDVVGRVMAAKEHRRAKPVASNHEQAGLNAHADERALPEPS